MLENEKIILTTIQHDVREENEKPQVSHEQFTRNFLRTLIKAYKYLHPEIKP